MRYTITMSIYIDAHNDKHAVSKAKLIAERERAKYPNQQCAVEEVHCTPFASLHTRKVDMNQYPKGSYLNELPPSDYQLDN